MKQTNTIYMRFYLTEGFNKLLVKKNSNIFSIKETQFTCLRQKIN